MTTPLFLLRCKQLGLSMTELDLLTIGLGDLGHFWAGETSACRHSDGQLVPAAAVHRHLSVCHDYPVQLHYSSGGN